MRKGIIYCRVSSTRQSNERQLPTLIEYSNNNDIHIVRTFEDKITGTSNTDERVEMKALMNFIDENGIDIILVNELSRIGRNAADVLTFIKKYKDAKIPIYFADKGILTLNLDGSNNDRADFTIGILSVMAEHERTQIIQRTSEGKFNSIVKNHKWSNGVPPFGFAKDFNGMLIPHPEHSKMLIQIYEMYASGLSTLKIANYLNSISYPTRYGIGQWWEGTVRQIIMSEFSKGIRYYQGKHKIPSPAIISEDLWQKANDRMNLMKGQKHKRKYNYKIPSYKLKCGVCGGNMVYVNRGTTSSVNCNTHRYGNRCSNYGIGISTLYNSIYSTVKDLTTMLSKRDLLEEQRLIHNKIIHLETEKSIIESSLQTAETRIRRVKYMFENMIDDESEFNRKYNEIKSTTIKQEESIAAINIEILKLKNINIADNYEFDPNNKDRVNESINDLIDCILIYPILNNELHAKLDFSNRKLEYYYFVEVHTNMQKPPLKYIVTRYSKRLMNLVPFKEDGFTPIKYIYDKEKFIFHINQRVSNEYLLQLNNKIHDEFDYQSFWNHRV